MSCEIFIKATPKASKSEIVSCSEGIWTIRLKALPEKGKANAELIRLLSKILKIPSSNIEIIQGNSSRIKKIKIEGLDGKRVKELLSDRTRESK